MLIFGETGVTFINRCFDDMKHDQFQKQCFTLCDISIGPESPSDVFFFKASWQDQKDHLGKLQQHNLRHVGENSLQTPVPLGWNGMMQMLMMNG